MEFGIEVLLVASLRAPYRKEEQASAENLSL